MSKTKETIIVIIGALLINICVFFITRTITLWYLQKTSKNNIDIVTPYNAPTNSDKDLEKIIIETPTVTPERIEPEEITPIFDPGFV